MAKDGLAKLTLKDGREVWRDGAGRYRDAKTGKWVARYEIETGIPENCWLPEKDALPPQNAGQAAANARPAQPGNAISHQLVEVMQNFGLPVKTPEEALAYLVGVQAEIALDKDNGAKATNAVRLIGQLTGMLGKSKQEEATEAQDEPWFVLGRKAAKELLTMIEEEQKTREE